MKKRTIFAMALLSLAANLAVARDIGEEQHRCHESHWCMSAPEIDPGQAVGALALLGGTLAIVRGYRRRKK